MKRPDSSPNDAAGAGCPPEETWRRLAAGLLAEDAAAQYAAHASKCAQCAPLLREAAQDLAMEPTEQEMAEVSAALTPEWQRELASRMAASSFRAEPVRSTGWRIPAWAYGAAAAVVIAAVGLGWWMAPLRRADRLLASAFAQRRELDFRFGYAAYSSKTVTRGESAPRPADLSDAEAIVTRNLVGHREDVPWLITDGKVKLLNRAYEEAEKQFLRASEIDPQSLPAKLYLATAYYQLAQQEGDRGAIYYGKADDLLGQVLARDPNNLEALFNRAITAERILAVQAAIDYWNRYLKLDSASGWANEARRHLEEDQRSLKNRSATPRQFHNPEEFVANFDPASIDQQAEDYASVATREWLGSALAREATRLLAAILQDKHRDSWLRDMSSRVSGQASAAAMQKLRLAMAEDDKSHFSDGAKAAAAAKSLFDRLGNPAGALRAQLERAYALQRSLQAKPCLDASQGLDEAAHARGYLWVEARALLVESACWSQLGDKDLAEMKLEAAAMVNESANFARLRVQSIASRGVVATRRGDFVSSWDFGRRSLLGYAAGTVSPRQALAVYSDLVFVSDLQDQRFLALDLAREAVDLGAATEPLQEANERFRMARMASAIGEHAIASQQFARADQLYASLPEDKTAASYRVWVQTALARLEMSRGENEGALRRLDNLHAAAIVIPSYSIPLQYYAALGEAAYRSREMAGAGRSLGTAVQLAEYGLTTLKDERNRITWNRETSSTYRTLVQVRLDGVDRGADALAIWEWYRAAPLRAPSASLQARASSPVFSVKDLEGSSLDYDRIGFERAIQALGDETVLTYAFLPGGLAIWITDRNGIEARVLRSDEKIARLAKRFGEECARPDSDIAIVRRLGRELYDDLIGPIAARITSKRSLTIESDGPITEVPFQALIAPDGSYLGERYDLSSTPGLFFRQRLRPVANLTAQSPALVVGVEAASAGRVALPEAVKEAKGVAGLFPRARVLLGDAATEANIRRELPRAVVIHFATHGQTGPHGTGLWLASDRGPVLLGADRLLAGGAGQGQLVVLSACETGSTDVDGLVRAFSAAGVPRIVASRWSVDSVTATRFMDAFYATLLSTGSVAGAMRQAAGKVRFAGATSHPYYWAAFEDFGMS